MTLPDVSTLLNDNSGNHAKIREFREKLEPSVRELFDSILALGLREGILMGNLVLVNTEERDFVRLGPTTLYLRPDCYGNNDVMMDCSLCPVKKACSEGQEVEKWSR